MKKMVRQKISIIIPTFNEEKALGLRLKELSPRTMSEIIVVDGGSYDQTVISAQQFPVTVIHASKNRALQMNRGAQASQGDILVFLHADCSLEEGSLSAIRECIGKGYIGGCLTHKIDCSRLVYRAIEFSGTLRAKLFNIFYGDQAIFVRRDVFFTLGGFDTVDLFDDVLFSKKLKRAGKTCVLSRRVYTSARRWENQGVIRATLIHWILSVGFFLGVPSYRLKKIYFEVR